MLLRAFSGGPKNGQGKFFRQKLFQNNLAKLFFTTLFAIATLGAMPAHATTVTIDFGTHVDNQFNTGATYTEDGYTFNVEAGSEFRITDNYSGTSNGDVAIGNPPSGLLIDSDASVQENSWISIKADDNSRFTFDAVDYAAAFVPNSGQGPFPSDFVMFEGLVAGNVVATYSSLSSTVATFDTLDSLFLNSIDELRIIVPTLGNMPLVLDNFVFTTAPSEVPLPAALPLFIAGIAGIGAVSRRRRKLAAR